MPRCTCGRKSSEKSAPSGRFPDALLLEFLQGSYEAAARLGNWQLSALERKEPVKTSGAS